eukprot:scaffold292292_cov17-Tisochrysis_lutea.AAC.1
MAPEIFDIHSGSQITNSIMECAMLSMQILTLVQRILPVEFRVYCSLRRLYSRSFQQKIRSADPQKLPACGGSQVPTPCIMETHWPKEP